MPHDAPPFDNGSGHGSHQLRSDLQPCEHAAQPCHVLLQGGQSRVCLSLGELLTPVRRSSFHGHRGQGRRMCLRRPIPALVRPTGRVSAVAGKGGFGALAPFFVLLLGRATLGAPTSSIVPRPPRPCRGCRRVRRGRCRRGHLADRILARLRVAYRGKITPHWLQVRQLMDTIKRSRKKEEENSLGWWMWVCRNSLALFPDDDSNACPSLG